MRHILVDEWSLPELDSSEMYKIEMRPHIFNYIKLNKIQAQELNFSDISYKVLPDDFRLTPRYEKADTSFPGIVATNMPNPDNRKYRLLDGAHRMDKNLLEGKVSGMFYVLDYSFVKDYIEPYGK